MDNLKVTKNLEEKTLTIERAFRTTKEKLWQAYADQAWFEKWWGPEGWETTTKTFDFKPGGTLHYGMKCVDKNQGEWFGQESWGLMQLQEVDAPNRFTALDYFSDPEGTLNEDMPAQKFTVELVEDGDMVRLVTTSTTETAEQLEELVQMGMVEGFGSQLNKLETLLNN